MRPDSCGQLQDDKQGAATFYQQMLTGDCETIVQKNWPQDHAGAWTDAE